MQYFLCHRWTSTYGTWERSKHVKAVEAIGDGASIHQIHDLNNVLQSLKKITLQQASKISKRAYSSKKHRTCFFFPITDLVMSYINSGDVSKRDQPDSYQPVHSGGSGSSLTTVLKTANAWGMTDVRQKLPS